MATLTQVQLLRIDISDPPGILEIIVVASSINLPGTPEAQAAYYINDEEIYVSTSKTSLATSADYDTLKLYLSDTKIGSIIDAYGIDKAVYKCIIYISSKIASELLIVKNETGSESVEYIKLLDLYKYYQKIIKLFKDEEKEKNLNNTGRWGQMTQPEIGGGNL